MLGIDIGNNGNRGHQFHKGTVALIGLRNKEFSLTQLGIAADAVQPSSDHDRGIKPSCRQNRGDEGSSCRFSVGPCDGNPHLHPHEFGQHLCPGDHRNESLLRHPDLGIVPSDG